MKLRLLDADPNKWYHGYVNGYCTIFKFNTSDTTGVYRNNIHVETYDAASTYKVETKLYARCTTIKGKVFSLQLVFRRDSYVTKDDIKEFKKNDLIAYERGVDKSLQSFYQQRAKIDKMIEDSENLVNNLKTIEV